MVDMCYQFHDNLIRDDIACAQPTRRRVLLINDNE
jgi:hypothetical protein